MSYSIPIFLEDSPFFERDRLYQRQPRNKSQRRREGEPDDAWQTWTTRRPEFAFEEGPHDDGYHRPIYQNRGRREEFVEQPKRNERPVRSQPKARTQKLGGGQETVYVTEDPRGINVDTSDHYGWDIPVQFVEATGTSNGRFQHRRHKQQQEPRHCTTRENNAQTKDDKVQPQAKIDEVQARGDQRLHMPAQRQTQARGVNNDKVAKVVVVDQEKLKAGDEDDTTVEVLVDEAQKQQKEGRKDRTKNLENNEGKASKDDDGDTEIPVQHAFLDERPRSNSRRFSQCDPPPLMEIKLTRIESIIEKSQDLEKKIKEFADPVQNKTYLNISESLMRLLLDLDTVDSEGIDLVRKARKEAVQAIQCLVDELEIKLAENKRNAAPK